MRNTFSSIPYWMYWLLIVSLSPLAVYFGSIWRWTPGATAFAVLVVPVCAAALSGQRTTALIAALLATGGCLAEAVYNGPSYGGAPPFVFALFAACIFFAVSGVIAAIVDQIRQRLEQLEEQNTQFVRELYRRDRHQDEQAAAATDGTSESSSSSSEPAEPRSVDYAMLLLTVQDISRRISTNLDLETLLPTIISTAKTTLKCEECRICFWNARTETLTDALPPRGRDRASYRPRPRAGMAGWVLEHRHILTRHTVEDDYDLHALREEEPHLPDAVAPLTVGGELLGILVIDKVEQDSATFVRLLYILASIAALGIKNAQLFKRIEDMARRDGLTGLLNHASFQQELQQRLENAAAGSGTATVVMSDVDHFKKFNDTYGHQAGDHVLREVARMWKAVLPDYAVLARYGGEEFICVLPDDDVDRGRELAELLRESIEEYELDFEGRQLKVTASFGVAEYRRPAQTAQDLIRVADEAMYAAKEGGRNRVVANAAAHDRSVSKTTMS